MKKIIWICLVLSLVACKPNDDYQFYMLHPAKMQAQFKKCQSLTNPTADETKHCDVVQQAAKDFVALVKERSIDAEAFGEKILQKQTQLSLERKDLESLKSSADKNAFLAKQKDYEDKKQELAILLAVVAATSSE